MLEIICVGRLFVVLLVLLCMISYISPRCSMYMQRILTQDTIESVGLVDAPKCEMFASLIKKLSWADKSKFAVCRKSSPKIQVAKTRNTFIAGGRFIGRNSSDVCLMVNANDVADKIIC